MGPGPPQGYQGTLSNFRHNYTFLPVAFPNSIVSFISSTPSMAWLEHNSVSVAESMMHPITIRLANALHPLLFQRLEPSNGSGRAIHVRAFLVSQQPEVNVCNVLFDGYFLSVYDPVV